jgi:hypothetical protein
MLALGLEMVGCHGQPYTEWRERPVADRQAPPPGHAVFAAVLERADAKLDGRRLPANAEVTRSYTRILRRASVFTDVFGPAASGRPGAASLWLRSDLIVDDKAGGNVGRSVLIALSLSLLRPALPFQLDLDGEMELDVRLPGEGRVRSYRSSAAASRFYTHSSQHRSALEVVMREVTTENLRAIIAQLRADPALTAAPAFEHPR